ncbi:MAG TPA: dimethylsulfonioproprionate lyase family protein [Acidobacteriota bacterium]|nr:dimethylsulfonioproprionate lyase family protein [Acidobacteriota bacterium]
MSLMRVPVALSASVVAALLVVVPSVGHAQENRPGALRLPDPGEVDAVFAQFDAPGSVGCALGVAHQGQLIYKKGYGYANLDWDIPMGPTTVIYVGSISKQFTAAAIALLAHQGKLDLDDDAREHLPELPHREPPVTVRQFVHHTSGVPDMYGVMRDHELTTWDRFSREQALELLARQELDFPPGDRYQYSNGGYFLLSMIVQRASGKTLREYTREHIFEPLGMRNTHFHDDPVHIVKNRAMSYMPSEVQGPASGSRYIQSYQGNFALPGAGGLYTTVEDFVRWDRNFLDNRLGGPDFMEVMHGKGVLNSGEPLDYAFAIREDEHRGLRTLGHGGSFMGFKAHYVRLPDQQLSTWVMCNMGTIVPEDFALRVVDVYLTDAVSEASGPRSENSGQPAHANAVKLGWETTAFGIQRWNTVIGGETIPDDDLQVGLWELAPRAIYAGHVHPQPEFYVVLDGQAEWTLGDETFIAERGEVVYIAPNTMHRMVNLTDDMVQAIWGRWAPNGDRSLFEGEFRFVKPLPEQPPEAVFPVSGR